MTPEECFLRSISNGSNSITNPKEMEIFVSELAKNGHITQQDNWITSLFPQPSSSRPVTFDDFKRAVIDTEFKSERLTFEDHCSKVDESLDLLERQVKKALSYPSEVVNLHFILSTIQDLKKSIVGKGLSGDNEQDTKSQRYKNFFWSRIEGIELPPIMQIPQRLSLIGQQIKINRKKLQYPIKPKTNNSKQLQLGVQLIPALDSNRNKVDIIEIDVLNCSYSSYFKESQDFEICREFLPSKCFRIPLDVKIENNDKVWFIYEYNRYIPIINFFKGFNAIGEQSQLFLHWRSRIVSALCDISLYGSKFLLKPLNSNNIHICGDGDLICLLDIEWGSDKDLELKEEPLAISSLINIIEELIPNQQQGPVLKCILEICKENSCTIYDIARHPYFRSFQPLNEIKSLMRINRGKNDDNYLDD